MHIDVLTLFPEMDQKAAGKAKETEERKKKKDIPKAEEAVTRSASDIDLTEELFSLLKENNDTSCFDIIAFAKLTEALNICSICYPKIRLMLIFVNKWLCFLLLRSVQCILIA